MSFDKSHSVVGGGGTISSTEKSGGPEAAQAGCNATVRRLVAATVTANDARRHPWHRPAKVPPSRAAVTLRGRSSCLRFTLSIQMVMESPQWRTGGLQRAREPDAETGAPQELLARIVTPLRARHSATPHPRSSSQPGDLLFAFAEQSAPTRPVPVKSNPNACPSGAGCGREATAGNPPPPGVTAHVNQGRSGTILNVNHSHLGRASVSEETSGDGSRTSRDRLRRGSALILQPALTTGDALEQCEQT